MLARAFRERVVFPTFPVTCCLVQKGAADVKHTGTLQLKSPGIVVDFLCQILCVAFRENINVLLVSRRPSDALKTGELM
ncbi:hypothetical protein FIBSPDRAFT_848438 [Athelia psychrophila]|uniref:Uncharacterized protein n=1 Tax=Athelia psychrophila TaxID=1759441 RepID=A0A166VEB8_9AGAM|nr:hypothetical protein FIBSPDRAFT_848438 [Fibularhizoctonia sp. CBS 109695]